MQMYTYDSYTKSQGRNSKVKEIDSKIELIKTKEKIPQKTGL